MLYVNHAATPSCNGFTWATAFHNLQDAIAISNSNLAIDYQIWVAEGMYLPTVEFDADGSGGINVREKTFYINKDVEIYGGFVGTETMLSQRDWVAHPTVLSGDIDNTPDSLNNAYHVLFIDGTNAYGKITNACIIDGLQIKYGNADGNSQNIRGSGIYNYAKSSSNESSPSILNCNFTNNSAIGGGAIFNGAYNSGVSSPILTNCTFSNNSASFGGAICNDSSEYGVCEPMLTNCTFSNNTTSSGGGGAITNRSHYYSRTSLLLNNCTFSNNSVSNSGGAISNSCNWDSSTSLLLNNCTFSNNSASYGGVISNTRGVDGGASVLRIRNCSFSNNSVSNSGGVIYNGGFYGDDNGGRVWIINCTFSKNNSTTDGGAISSTGVGAQLKIANCIFWNNNSINGENEIDCNTGNTFNYSIIDDGIIDGTVILPPGLSGSNNLDVDPLFIDAPNGNLRLQLNSPAIDGGFNGAYGLSGITTDLDGNDRFSSSDPCFSVIDMGAYEIQWGNDCDEDGDGIVDYNDNCPQLPNPGLNFDGVDDYVELPNESNFDFTTAMTVEAWINVDVFDKSYQTIIGKGVDSWRLSRDGTTNQLHFSANGLSSPRFVNGSTDVNDGKWHHVAAVYDGTGLYLYVDGILDASTPTSGTIDNSNLPVWIGNNSQNTARQFDGTIDEVRIWNLARTQQEIQDYFSKELSGSETGLVAYYSFNEGLPKMDNTGLPSTITDITGNSNDGIMNTFTKDGTSSNWIIGAPVNLYDSDNDLIGDACDNCPTLINTSLNFDGADDYVELPNESNFDFTSAMTVEAWIKVGVFDKSYQTIIGKGVDSWRLSRDGTTNQLHFSANGLSSPRFVNGFTDVNDGKWHHVAAVYDGTGLYLYVDGILYASTPTSGTIDNSNLPVWIGNNSQNTARQFDGKIDEVRIWNIGRTLVEIQANRYKELTGTETGLVAYYNFNEGVPDQNNTSLPTSVNDVAGSNTGTLYNFAQHGSTSNWSNGSGINIGNPNQVDTDSDGFGDVCDICPDFDDALDGDADGIPDGCDCLPSEMEVYYPDTDGDGYGDENSSGISLCSGGNPVGYVLDNTDCDDTNDMDTDIIISGNPIVTGDYLANRKITSSGSIEVSTNITIFQAGQEIILVVGFIAAEGSKFQGLINTDCSTTPPLLVQEETQQDERATIAWNLTEETNKTNLVDLKLSPNPTKSQTTITFSIPKSGVSTLEVYNITGILIKQLADGKRMEQGKYTEELQTGHLSAGIYMVVLRTAKETVTEKLIVVE